MMYFNAFLTINAVAGGTHGHKESIKVITGGLKDDADKEDEWSEDRLLKYSEFFGEPVAKLKEMVKRGWKPQMVLKE
jgi:hypothetical protein